MMAHKRTEIRNAVASILLNANTAAGSRVHVNRVHNISKHDTPYINIYTSEESSTPRDARNLGTIRKLTLQLEVGIHAKTSSDEFLDDLTLEIETALLNNQKLNGTATGMVYQTAEFNFEQGDTTTGRATLTYEITYLT